MAKGKGKGKDKDLKYLAQKGNMWYVVLRINGKKVWHPAGPDPDEARKLRNKLLFQIDSKEYSYNRARVRYDLFLTETFLPYVTTHPRYVRSTYEGYERIVRLHLIPILGRLRLDQIDPLTVFRYLRGKHNEGQLKDRTIRHHEMVIRSSLKCARKLGILTANPLRDAEGWSFTEDDRELPSETEVATILNAIRHTRYYLPAVLSMGSTPRRGEILAEKWHRIDWQKEGMHITETLYSSTEGLVWQRPKTKRSKRLLALPHSVIELLAEHKRAQDEQKVALGNLYNDNDLVFCRPDGQPINPSTFSSGWCSLIKRLKLPHMTFHDFRHYCIDTLYDLGTDESTIMNLAGHTIRTTTRGYSHPDFHRKKRAVEHADSKLKKLRKPLVVEDAVEGN